MLNQTQSKLICLSKPKWVSCEIEYRTAEKWKSMLIKMWFLLLTTPGSRTPNLVEWYLININLKFIILFRVSFRCLPIKAWQWIANVFAGQTAMSNHRPHKPMNQTKVAMLVASRYKANTLRYLSRIVGCSQEGQ